MMNNLFINQDYFTMNNDIEKQLILNKDPTLYPQLPITDNKSCIRQTCSCFIFPTIVAIIVILNTSFIVLSYDGNSSSSQ